VADVVNTEEEDEGSFSQGRWVPPVYRWPKISDGELQVIRKRQRERARVMALLLAAFVVLLFFITLAKTGMNW
jgi:hypothetical protein